MNRRDFLKSSTLTTLAVAGLSSEPVALFAQEANAAAGDAPSGPPIGCGVIGLGERGREVVNTLNHLATLPPVAICDIYEPFLKRTQEAAPKAAAYSDYRQLLEDKNVQAVVVATPTHQHKQIVLDALQAGKHVYCEAPIANTLDDAKAIALAGQGAAPKLIFQAGLQQRIHPQSLHVYKFIRSNALGTIAACRSQWHQKTSWRRAAPDPQRQQEINWRLDKAISPGLMGEIGIHGINLTSWYVGGQPVAATGRGGVLFWKDGREVPDTVQAIIEYPGGVNLVYDITLVNSFDDSYNLFMGSQSAILVRGDKAWMVNEADAPLEGWIVYARKEPVGDDVGVVLVADATKLLALGQMPSQAKQEDPTKTMLYHALEAFVNSIHSGKPSEAGPLEGYQATVAALKTNEAIVNGSRLEFKQEWFQLS
jgi:predicted dehydrogenase